MVSASAEGAILNYSPYEYFNSPDVAFFPSISGIVCTPSSSTSVNGWAQPFTDANTPLGTALSDGSLVKQEEDLQRSSLISKVDEDGQLTVKRYPKYKLNGESGRDFEVGNKIWQGSALESPISFYGLPVKSLGAKPLRGTNGQGSVYLGEKDLFKDQYAYAGNTPWRYGRTGSLIYYKGRPIEKPSNVGNFVSAGVLEIEGTKWLLAIYTTLAVVNNSGGLYQDTYLKNDRFYVGELKLGSHKASVIGGMRLIHQEDYPDTTLGNTEDLMVNDLNFGSWVIDSKGTSGATFRNGEQFAFYRTKLSFEVISNEVEPVSIVFTEEDATPLEVRTQEITTVQFYLENGDPNGLPKSFSTFESLKSEKVVVAIDYVGVDEQQLMYDSVVETSSPIEGAYTVSYEISAYVLKNGVKDFLFEESHFAEFSLNYSVNFIYIDLEMGVFGWYVFLTDGFNNAPSRTEITEHWIFPWGTKNYPPVVSFG